MRAPTKHALPQGRWIGLGIVVLVLLLFLFFGKALYKFLKQDGNLTRLNEAVQMDSKYLVRKYLAAGEDPNVADGYRRRPISLVRGEEAALILLEGGVSLLDTFEWALYEQRLEVVKACMKFDFPRLQQAMRFVDRPWLYAYANSAEMMEALDPFGVDPGEACAFDRVRRARCHSTMR